ncbi:helix-turn-helix domain-containing protein [Nocardia testacea]|uniref:helix-turn-helix domain-containing protein n=1 Tax=Nocardia testacea TaxID=248551 RepID=UPI0033F91DE5
MTGEGGAGPVKVRSDVRTARGHLLRAFLAVAEEGHFGHAARSIGVAQPALSRQVQQLERLLGVVLFDPHPSGCRTHPSRPSDRAARRAGAGSEPAAGARRPVGGRRP